MTSGTPKTAVVADDHELPRVALSSLLQSKLGFETVIEAASLDEAIDGLEQAPGAAILLLDLHMPGVESAASLQAVRETYPAVKLVIVSASTRREDMLMALTAGAHGYVPKLTRMDDIAAALRDVLDGRISVPASIADVGPAEDRARRGGETPDLTTRQTDVLRLIRSGLSNKEIARTLDLGVGTVKVHVAGLFRALGVSNRAGAISASDNRPSDDADAVPPRRAG